MQPVRPLRANKRVNFVPLEHEEQAALIGWSKYHPICKLYLRAIEQAGKRSYGQACFLKKRGLTAGTSDLLLAYPAHGKCGMWIEMKRKDPKLSRVSEDQKDFLELMKGVGYEAVIAYGWEDARDKILNYLTEGEKNGSD